MSMRSGSATLDRILDRLERVGKVGSKGWVATCPAHDDSTPSLSLTIGDDHRILILCRAGCPTGTVLAAVGLRMADLYERPSTMRRLVATYDYLDARADLVYQVCRYDPKDFRVRRPATGGWSWRLGDAPRVLYRLPELVALDDGDRVVIVEGEKDADRLAALGFVATTNLGGAGKWRAEYGEWLRGRDVAIIADNDAPGRSHAIDIARALSPVAVGVRIVELPGLRSKGDVSDWLERGGTCDGLLELIAATPLITPHADHEGAGKGTSQVPPGQRDTIAGPPIATLAASLDALVAHLSRFIHFSRPEQAHAVALWAAHTHAPLERLEQSPILAVTSAVKQSGKTRLFDVLEHVVRKPWRVIRPSEAVLFRKIDADHPTVLLDEVDAIFNDRAGNTEAIRALFNSGNRQGTWVPRAVAKGRDFSLVEFDVFCPKATAGIGGLPETILDRAIVIRMQRRAAGERVERLRDRQARALGLPLRDSLTFHVARIDELLVEDAIFPPELDERAQDGWEPLFAIAAAAGGDWPSLARRAAVALFATRRPTDDSLELRLLDDVRQVFAGTAAEFLATAELREGLLAIEAAPWGDIRGKPITSHYLAKMLGRFDIGSRRHRPLGVGNPVHGYFRSELVDPWTRYLGAETGTSDTSGTAAETKQAQPLHSVPDVPLVPDPERPKLLPWKIPVDPDEWVIGTA
jgi:hypothetical protein